MDDVKIKLAERNIGREVGEPGATSPSDKSLSPLSLNTPNKKVSENSEKNKKVRMQCGCMARNWTFDTQESKEALYFKGGDSFSKVRGLINKMRSKVKTKFAQKNKKA